MNNFLKKKFPINNFSGNFSHLDFGPSPLGRIPTPFPGDGRGGVEQPPPPPLQPLHQHVAREARGAGHGGETNSGLHRCGR